MQGAPSTPVRSTKTVSALCNLFLDAVSPNPYPGVERFGEVPLKPGSLQTDVSILRRHCDARPFPMKGGTPTESGKRFGALLVSEVTPADVKRLLDDMRDKGYVVNTRQKLHTILKQVFQYGIQIGWLKADSDTGYRTAIQATLKPRGPRTVRAFLNASEARTLLDVAHASGNRWADAVEVLIRTGLRRGELLGLQWGKVSLDDEGGWWMLVDVALHREAEGLGRPSHLVLGPAKTTSSRREVKLMPETVEALKRQCERQQAEQMAAGSRWIGGDAGSDDMPIFATIFGGWSETTVLNEGFRAIADAAGFPKLTIHGCRHTFVSIVGDQVLRETGKIDWQVLADLCGHTNPAVTRRVYAHLDQGVVDRVRRASWDQAGEVRI